MSNLGQSQQCQVCCYCCKLRGTFCCNCRLCYECCTCCCAPIELPKIPCIPPIPAIPSVPGQCECPSPCPSEQPIYVQVVREQIFVPCPYPVPMCPPRPRRISCECDYDETDCEQQEYNRCYPARKYEEYQRCTPCCSAICPQDLCSCPCPWPRCKLIHSPGCPVIPGYKGHIPGMKFHGAGRSFGNATKDTRCIMSQWNELPYCPRLPSRIWEQ